MDQKDFEDRLDGIADRLSDTVSSGVKRLEAAYEKGKDNLKEDMAREGEKKRLSGSPRLGLFLLIGGFLLLLHIKGLFDNLVLPIAMMAGGIYLIVRNRNKNQDLEKPPGE